MALDTLEIFGDEFTNVAGIKATDDNNQIKTYIRPQGTKSISANGTGIDVTAYASVDVSVSSGVDMPIYTADMDSQTSTFTVTCNWTFQEVEDYYLDDGKYQATLRTAQDGVFILDMPMSVNYDASDISNVGMRGIAIYDDGLPTIEIFHTPNDNIILISPPSALAQLSVTQNGTYYPPQGKLYNEVTVNVSGGSPTIQSLTVTPTTSQQTFNASGVDGYKPVVVNAMPSGTAGTPTATKGTVSNHSVSVTPSVTNTTGYITGSTKTGTAVTVSASELVSGSETKTANGTYDVTNLAELVVNVSGGTSKNAQVVQGTTRTNASTLTAIGAEMTVSKTGTYDIYYSCLRTNTSSSYTWATRLYINGTAYGTAENTTWTNNQQNIHLSNISLTADDKLRVYGRETRGASYYVCAPMLVIIEA